MKAVVHDLASGLTDHKTTITARIERFLSHGSDYFSVQQENKAQNKESSS